MKRRIHDEAAYVLHSYDWSESSLILEVFTQNQGRSIVLAKGVKRPLSSFRSVLLPLQLLRLSFAYSANHETEIATLKAAEWGGGQIMPSGANLLSGMYINELVLRLLAREDAHPALFDHYHTTVQNLSGLDEVHSPALLRSFELLLLRELGYLPQLGAAALGQTDLNEKQSYILRAQLGLCEARSEEEQTQGISGAHWQQIAQVIASSADQDQIVPRLMQTVASMPATALRVQLRKLVQFHTDGQVLRSRRFMQALQTL